MKIALQNRNHDIAILLGLAFLLLITFLNMPKVYASSSSVIEADVKIGVCGDLKAAGVEQCDNNDLRNRTCVDFGHGGGSLSCDSACDFDFSGCVGTTVVTRPNPSNTAGGGGREGSVPIDSAYVKVLPLIEPFDLNDNGQISQNELADLLANWINIRYTEHKGICDLNADEKCNVIDFSILMYYVNRQR